MAARSISVLVPLMAAAMALTAPSAAEPAHGPPPSRAAAERELTVLNRSGTAINQLYVSPSSADSWGEDRLGEEVLSPGKSVRLKLGRLRDCTFDVQVIYDDARSEEIHQVDACGKTPLAVDAAHAVAMPPFGVEHPLTVVNQAALPIQQLFVSPSDANQWGDDRLADGSISVGERKQLRYRGPCTADLRVVFTNRSAEERHGLDICAATALLIEPGWTTADPVRVAPMAPAATAAASPPDAPSGK